MTQASTQKQLTAWETFIRELPRPWNQDWTHWTTLTFAHDVPMDRAKAALRRWLRATAKHVRTHVMYAAILETRDRNRSGLHIHVLVAVLGGAEIALSWLDATWKSCDPVANFVRANVYDPVNGGASRYLASKTALGVFETNVACPRPRACRRKKGCVVARSPWR